jgi:putative nucleotidyltransferase with HDIG domain
MGRIFLCMATRGSAAARVFLYPVRHIRWRIIAPYALLTLLLAAGGAYLVTRLVVSSFEERFDNQLAEASRVAADSVVRHESKHLETVRSVAFTEGLAPAVETHDTATVQRLAEPLAANDRAALIEVLDASGHRVYGAKLSDDTSLRYAALTDPDDRTSWPIVEAVLARAADRLGDKYADIEPTPAGPALYTAGPVYDGDRLAGVVLVGTPLAQLPPEIKAEALADVTLYDARENPLASTLSAESRDGQLRPGTGLLDPRRDGSEHAREHKELSGRGFDLLYGDLVVRDRAIGSYSVALPSAFVLSAAVATRTELVLLFAFATVAVLGLGWLISRTITGPVFRLAATARAVSRGDLSARSGLSGADEIGTLGSAFDAMTDRLQRQHLGTIRALASAIDARDPHTMGHSLRVGQLAAEIGRELRVEAADLQHLEVGGYLHDIGKIGVRDAVLLKEGTLTPDERAAIERHPIIGLEILAPVELPPDVLEFVGSHHEKLDGSGYPHGINGSAIGLVTRVATVADIYDALTSDRPYRRGFSMEQALDLLRREVAAGAVDAAAVAALERVAPRWEQRVRLDPAVARRALGDGPDQKAA